MPSRLLPVGATRIKVDRHGNSYRIIKVANPSKWEYEHRIVAKMKIGRKLYSDEVVHHWDEDTLNNDPDNLAVWTRSYHALFHWARGEGYYPYS